MRSVMKKPPRLQEGDHVALIAPSSPVSEEKLSLAIESLSFLKLIPVVYPSCTCRRGYLSGSDQQRAADLNDAFRDDSIRGIFCIRGGYGAARILTLLDLETISLHPKIFHGYSDITALHVLFQQECRLVTFHGPMPSAGYQKFDPDTLASLNHALFKRRPWGEVLPLGDQPITTIYPGETTGLIVGGNLSVLVSTLGSPFEVDCRNKILFLEETGEEPYKIDKALTALALAGKFEDCAGIILGTWSDCEAKEEDREDSLSLEEIFDDVVRPWRKPTINHFRAGHVYPQITIPMGTRIKLDASAGKVYFLESGVR